MCHHIQLPCILCVCVSGKTLSSLSELKMVSLPWGEGRWAETEEENEINDLEPRVRAGGDRGENPVRSYHITNEGTNLRKVPESGFLAATDVCEHLYKSPCAYVCACV